MSYSTHVALSLLVTLLLLSEQDDLVNAPENVKGKQFDII